MREKIKILIFTLLCFFNSNYSYSIWHRVINLNDNGAGSLRDEITNASPGDTVFIDVKGAIVLNSGINISNNITIIGPYPAHNTIVASNIFFGSYLLTVNANVDIQGIKLQNVNTISNLIGLRVTPGATLNMYDCVLKEFTYSAIEAEGTMNLFNTSINDNFSNTGPAVQVFNTASVKFTNCTFYNNNSPTASAGAIQTSGLTTIINCTFAQNSSSNASDLTGFSPAVITIQNNLFASTSTNIINSGATWVSNGGNVFNTSAVSLMFFSNLSNIYTQSLAAINFRSSILIDGYGLEYLPILSGSSAIDVGTPVINLLIDCRRAPRTLWGTNANTPDAGAYEYTPYKITTSSPLGPGSISQALSSINVATWTSVFFIEFDIPAPTPIVLSGLLPTISKEVIIDGYTQPGSSIWGPGNTPLITTPFNLPIQLNGNTVVADGLIFAVGSNNSKVSGIEITGFTDAAILCFNTNSIKIVGNYLRNNLNGVSTNNSNQIVIGAQYYNNRNVINNNSNYGIILPVGNNNEIVNNFIGVNLLGNLAAGNAGGISINNNTNIKIGGRIDKIEGNVISGNSTRAIDILGGVNGCIIAGNILGLNWQGLFTLGNQNIGVSVTGINNNDIIIGGYNPSYTNVISGNSTHGISVVNQSPTIPLQIITNLIGTNILGSAAVANLQNGVFINGSQNAVVAFNVLSGNTNNGIQLTGSSNINILSNFIGTDVTGSAAIPNVTSGIASNLNSNTINIYRNKISNNLDHGISINNSSFINIGSPNPLDSNIISNNTNNGVKILGVSSSGVNIQKNRIFANGGLGISLNALNAPLLNDPGDVDSGPNGLQNYAENIFAVVCGTGISLGGNLNVEPGNTYKIDFYLIPPGEENAPALSGEGGIFLTSALVFAVIGNEPFSVNAVLPVVVNPGDRITSICSKEIGPGIFSSSEFSANTTVITSTLNATASATDALCNGANNGILTANPSNGILPYYYQWYDILNNPVSGYITQTVNSVPPGDYYCVVSDNSGCYVQTNTVTVSQPSAVSVTVTSTNETCAGANDGSITITATGGTPGYVYSIDNGVSYFAGSVFNSLSPGIYSILVQDVNSCISNLFSQTIGPGLVPDPGFSYGTTTFCNSDALSYTPSINTSGGLFNVVGGLGLNFNAVTGELFPALSVPGTYSFYYTLLTPCPASDTIVLTILPNPTVIINPVSPVCLNSAPVTLTANPSGGIFSGLGVSAGQFDPSVAGVGSHNILYTYTDANNCIGTNTIAISVLSLPLVSISALDTVCLNTGLVNLAGTPNGGIFSGIAVSGNTFNATSAGVGTHTIIYTYTDGNGCSNTSMHVIHVIPQPLAPSFAPPVYQFCNIASAVNALGQAMAQYNWYLDAALTQNIFTGQSYISSYSGLNTFYVTQSFGACSSPAGQVDIELIDNSYVSNGGPYLVCPGNPIQLNIIALPNSTIQWNTSTMLSDLISFTPSATVSQNTSFQFSVTLSPSNCIITDSVSVIIDMGPNCATVSYNAFSPDGDGVNELWIIDGVYLHPNNRVTLFNRWGDKLINFTNYDNVNVVWDGRISGNMMPSGTYFYLVEYLDINFSLTGWVQLTR